MIVVSDASPIISLAAVGRLDLLRSLYATLIVPSGVYHEVVEEGAGQPGAEQVRQSGWIETRQVSDAAAVAALLGRLHRGEAESVVLAREIGADLLLVDEKRARTEAERAGLHCAGILGSLVAAKAAGIIPEVRPVLDDLINQAGMYLKGSLYIRVLREVGE